MPAKTPATNARRITTSTDASVDRFRKCNVTTPGFCSAKIATIARMTPTNIKIHCMTCPLPQRRPP